MLLEPQETPRGRMSSKASCGIPRFETASIQCAAGGLALGVDLEQRLAEFDRRAVLDKHCDNLAGGLRRNLVEHLHRFNNADNGVGADMIANFDKWRSF